ncbi:DUF3014 domain-containing protein [Arenimonas sp.]|uniref:DUF3014 domain-containing protein n=1 Tax=Arenimonas sp. TaxID=1872635 RepID=UPI0035AF0052
MGNTFKAGPWLALGFVAVCGVLAWKFYPRAASGDETPVVAKAPEPIGMPYEPEVRHPIENVPVVPETAPAEPLPTLSDSDPVAWAALAGLLDGDDLATWLVPEYLVQRLVTTIDNLPRRDITRQVYAARPVAGNFAVSGTDGQSVLDPANFTRYDAAVAAFEAVDPARLVSAYVRLYPLFEQAYREVAAPGQTFNDRLVEVIDHLLAAPDPGAGLAVVPVPGQPRWAFADPRLEQASIGHKALWRMGPAHAARVKARLAQLRGLLAAQAPVR